MEVVPSHRHEFSWPHRSMRTGGTTNMDKKHSTLHKTQVLHMWRSGDFSDAILNVEGVTYQVHRNVLACSSDYFRTLFTYSLHPRLGDERNIQTDAPMSNTTDPRTKSKTQARRICFTSSTPPSTPQLPVTASDQHYHNPLHKSATTSRRKCVRRTKTSSFHTINEERVPEPNLKPRRFEVTLCDVRADVMNKVLEHVYGGNVTITQDNVEEILTAADRFQVASLVLACCDFLSKQLSPHNCISIIQFSSNFYGCATLKEAAKQYLLENFDIVYKTSPEFVQLAVPELLAILLDDCLNVKREENILDAVVKWVLADKESREGNIPSLIDCARVGSFLPGMTQGSMVLGNHSSHNVAMADTYGVISKVMRSVAERQQKLLTQNDFTLFVPRLPRDVLFVIGGSNFGFPLGLVEVFDSRTWNWHNIGAYEFAPRSYHGVVHIDKHIYILGGFDGQSYLSSCCRFSPGDTHDMSWESVTPMNTKRCYVGVAQVQGSIYAIGGYDGGYRLNSAERFDVMTNQWSFISPMAHHRSDAGVAVLDDKIYVCGGFSGSECIMSVEMYDPETEEWIMQPSMPDGRSGLGVISHGGCLYAVGGFNGVDNSVRLSSMECYNPGTKQWTTLSPMPHPRSNLAVAVMEDTLYAIGGYNGERTSAVVECYNFENDSWYQATRLSQSRSALSVCILSGLSNTASLLGRESSDDLVDEYYDHGDDYSNSGGSFIDDGGVDELANGDTQRHD